MARLARQDPTFDARLNPETGQTIVSGMGELHLEVIKNRMEREFNLKIRVHKPRVSYRETVKGTAPIAGRGEFDRPLPEGQVDHAVVTVSLERFESDDPVTFVSALPHDFPKATLEVVKQSALDEARGGGVVGYPLSGVKLTVKSVDHVPGTTSDTALSAAAARAVRDCLAEKDCVLLEPKMKLEVVTPGEFLGNIQADLQSRRAMITGAEPRGDLTVVDAEVALAKMFGYSTQVRSLSQGRASYSMELLKYDAAPPEVLAEMLN